MSQPDTFPEGAPRSGDLRAQPFPPGDWTEPAARLEALYRWAEESALRTADWYLRGRLPKRRAARALRLGTTVCGAAAAALPLIELASSQGALARWGYLALLLAGACAAADRLLGLTTGWMRDMATAQAVQRRVDAFRFDWAAEGVREVLGPAEGTGAEAVERCLGVLRGFCDDIADLVRVETSDWMSAFGSPCPTATPAPPSRPEPRPRSPRPTRITMPHQRPPEPPRF
ncbi:SLATT domain-containing protein [Actinacidiphila sp. bgisy144]|uniref:SLATT domain-containing protein n=1 Tax=Actinacidiphila sp. bgisy144 TaxID=3413791 RepID=UPI003EBBDE3E